jgi:hypothetical protein
MGAGKKNTRGRIDERARHNGNESGAMRLALDSRIRNRSAFLSLGGRMQSARSVSVPAIFLVRQTKKAGAWPASADCSSAVSRLTLIRRAVPWFEAHWAFEIYVRRRRVELRLACACRAQLAVRAAGSMPGLVAVVLGLLSVRYELGCTAKTTSCSLSPAPGLVDRCPVTAGSASECGFFLRLSHGLLRTEDNQLSRISAT